MYGNMLTLSHDVCFYILIQGRVIVLVVAFFIYISNAWNTSLLSTFV